MESGALKMPPRVLPSSWNFSMRTFVSGCVADFAMTLLVIRTFPENLFAVAESKGSSRYRLPETGYDPCRICGGMPYMISGAAAARHHSHSFLWPALRLMQSGRRSTARSLALSGQRGLPIDSESDITESEQKNLIFVAGGDMHSLKYEGQR